SNRIWPAWMRPGGGTNPMIDSDSMLLPEPLSPTMPRVVPGRTCRLTPSTARTSPMGVWNAVTRSRTSSMGASMDAPSGQRKSQGRDLRDTAMRHQVELRHALGRALLGLVHRGSGRGAVDGEQFARIHHLAAIDI